MVFAHVAQDCPALAVVSGAGVGAFAALGVSVAVNAGSLLYQFVRIRGSCCI